MVFQKSGRSAPGCMIYLYRERGNRGERARKMEHDRVEVQTGYSAGDQTAYTECLEFIRLWERAAEHGLDFEIEERYPL